MKRNLLPLTALALALAGCVPTHAYDMAYADGVLTTQEAVFLLSLATITTFGVVVFFQGWPGRR